MKYFVGFMIGFIIASISWIFVLTTKPDPYIVAKVSCEEQGFNFFTVDADGNFICKNIEKTK